MVATALASAFAVYMSRPWLLAAPALLLASSDTTMTHRPAERPRIPTPPPERSLTTGREFHTGHRRATGRCFASGVPRRAGRKCRGARMAAAFRVRAARDLH